MEYCRHGCLRDYLVNKRNHFVDTMDDQVKNHIGTRRKTVQSTTDESTALHSYSNKNCVDENEDSESDDDEDLSPLTTKDLVCYAFQIARGMEFLTSKMASSVQLYVN